jgi:hypothetical protein
MIANSIRERLTREPFEPFVIRSSSGRAVRVASPDLVVLMKSEVFVASPNSDRWTQIPYLPFAGLKRVGNVGRAGPRRRA